MKITPEIEAVARAIALVNGEQYEWDLFVDDAIAAIRALRVPTDGMATAGFKKRGQVAGLLDTYTAMLDAALGENK